MLYVRAAMARMPNFDGARAWASTSNVTVCAPFDPQEPTDSQRTPRAARVRPPLAEGGSGGFMVRQPESLDAGAPHDASFGTTCRPGSLPCSEAPLPSALMYLLWG